MRKGIAVAFAAVTLGSCGTSASPEYTLYLNSRMDAGARIHWASFDTRDSGDYNHENCEMAVDLLRANLRELNSGEEPVRFWCELGPPRDIS